MYFLPLFERITDQQIRKISRNDVVFSIKNELECILKHRVGQLPDNYTKTDLSKWIYSITSKIQIHEPRLKNLSVTVLKIEKKQIMLEIIGDLFFDKTKQSFIINV